jgi:hypothetical protein
MSGAAIKAEASLLDEKKGCQECLTATSGAAASRSIHCKWRKSSLRKKGIERKSTKCDELSI